ncbi:Versatile peroxidase VPL1 like protein [Verticillium longisporum]|nr:Versatile peroxidase VPL1 like protein [Verticillium longisporum]
MGANVATVTCPLGPRIKTYVGRKDSATPAPDNLLPDVNADADSLIALFRDKTIGPHGLVALVGAHTTSQQMFVNESRAGDPQDSTPGVWDVKFYPETTGKAPARVFRFPSDIKLSQHPTTKKEWKEFSGGGGQNHWNEDYAREYIRLSLLGVNNINKLTECTKVLPPTTKKFSPSDQRKVEKWLNNTDRKGKAAKIAENLLAGDLVVDDVPATASPTAPATVTPAA